MNKKLNVIAGAVVLLVLAGGSLYYFEQKSLTEKELQFKDQMLRFQESLPLGAKQDNILEKGIFSSHGVYTLTYDEPKSNQNDTNSDTATIPKKELEHEKLTVTYVVRHGIESYFTHKVDIEAQSKIEGTITRYLTVKGDFLKTTGSIYRDGSFDMKSIGSDMSLAMNAETTKATLNFSPIESTINFTNATGEVKTMSSFATIIGQVNDSQRGEDKIEMHDLKVVRDFNIKQPGLGSFNFILGTGITRYGQLKGLDVQSKVDLTNNKYNMGAGIKVQEIIVPQSKVPLSLELNYSVNNINSGAINYYISLYDKYKKSGESDSKDKQEIHTNLLKIIQSGFIFNIDKAQIKGSFGSVTASGKWNVTPINTTDKIIDPIKVSLANQSKISVNISADGDITPMVANTINIALLGMQPQAIDPKIGYKVNGVYQKSNLLIDGNPTSNKALTDRIDLFFQLLDAQLQTNPEQEAVVDDGTETAQITVPKNSEVTVTVKQ